MINLQTVIEQFTMQASIVLSTFWLIFVVVFSWNHFADCDDFVRRVDDLFLCRFLNCCDWNVEEAQQRMCKLFKLKVRQTALYGLRYRKPVSELGGGAGWWTTTTTTALFKIQWLQLRWRSAAISWTKWWDVHFLGVKLCGIFFDGIIWYTVHCNCATKLNNWLVLVHWRIIHVN